MTTQKQDRYKTLFVIVVGFLALSAIFKSPILSSIALGIGVVSLLFPIAGGWIEWLWLKLALVLGWINTRILLSVLYFAFLLPIAWISRLFTKDPLLLKAKAAQTLYVTRDHQYKKEDLENIW